MRGIKLQYENMESLLRFWKHHEGEIIFLILQ